MIQKKNVFDFFKKVGLMSLFTLSFAGCGDNEVEVNDEVVVITDAQSGDLNDIVAEKNSSEKNAVYFGHGEIKVVASDSLEFIKDAAQFLQENKGVYIVLTGHVDPVAPNETINYNVALNRAYEVAHKLMALKVDSSRIYVKATTKQDADADQSKQRRVVFEYAAVTPKVGINIKKVGCKRKEVAVVVADNNVAKVSPLAAPAKKAQTKNGKKAKAKVKAAAKAVKSAPKAGDVEDLI